MQKLKALHCSIHLKPIDVIQDIQDMLVSTSSRAWMDINDYKSLLSDQTKFSDTTATLLQFQVAVIAKYKTKQ